MVTIVNADIFNTDSQVLVNPVNCVGVAGAGLALEFRKWYPQNYAAYHEACKAGMVRPGSIWMHQVHRILNPLYIANFPTKDHWRNPSQFEWIRSGLESLVTTLEDLGLESVSIPPVGCGLGGLKFAIVRRLIFDTFVPYPEIKVLLCAPR